MRSRWCGCRHAQDTSATHPRQHMQVRPSRHRHVRDTSATRPRHVRDTCRCGRARRDMSRTRPRHVHDNTPRAGATVRDTYETRTRHVRDTSETCPRHVRDKCSTAARPPRVARRLRGRLRRGRLLLQLGGRYGEMWGRCGGDMERYGAMWRLLRPRDARDVPRHIRDIPEIHPRYTRDTPEIHPTRAEMCPSRVLKVAAAAAAARAVGGASGGRGAGCDPRLYV